MTGPMGGSWYPLGGAIGEAIQKEIPGITVSVMPGGGVANVEAVELGKCDLGFSNSSSAVDGLNGRPPFKKKMENVRQLANLYAQYFQMVVVDSSKIKSVADFKGKIIATTPKAIPAPFCPSRFCRFTACPLKTWPKSILSGYSDAVALMKDGHADIYTPGTTIPASSIIDLAADRKIRLLPLPDDKIKALQKINAGYLKRTIPRVPIRAWIMMSRGLATLPIWSSAQNFPMTWFIKSPRPSCKNLPRFADVVKDMKGVTPKDLALDIGIPFHPGALKYYKEAGVLKSGDQDITEEIRTRITNCSIPLNL